MNKKKNKVGKSVGGEAANFSSSSQNYFSANLPKKNGENKRRFAAQMMMLSTSAASAAGGKGRRARRGNNGKGLSRTGSLVSAKVVVSNMDMVQKSKEV